MSGLTDHRRKRSLHELALACAAATAIAPRRSPRELQTLVQAAGLAPEDVSADFWRHVRRDWLNGDQDCEPFDSAANDEYRFLAEHRRLIAHCLACARPARAASPFCGAVCAELWTRAKRGYFSGPPLNMPVPAVDALLAALAAAPVPAEHAYALRRFLDGAA